MPRLGGTDMRVDQQASIARSFRTMLDRVLGPSAAGPPDARDLDLTCKQAKIRAASVRAGFAAMRARSEEVSRHLHRFDERGRNSTEAACDQVESPDPVEAIVLSCDEITPAQ